MATSTSLKDYLKKYVSDTEEDKKKKKKKKMKTKMNTLGAGVLVVDEDPVWQKPVNIDEEEENDSPDEKPLVDEDIEVKRMRRLEQLRARRSYNQISEDGSGWVSVSDTSKLDQSSDISPPRKRVARNDTPSPEAMPNPPASGREDDDLSPPRHRRRRYDSPSPQRSGFGSGGSDLSPPRQRRRRHDSPSLQPKEDMDLSPPRRRGRSAVVKDTDLDDLSPPRRVRHSSPHGSADLSPPRKTRKGTDRMDIISGAGPTSMDADLSPPRKRKDQQKTGLITGKDVSEEIAKTKKDEWLRFKEMDPSASGRGAEPVYRIKGERVSKEEYLKLTKKEEKPKEEKKLEWGKGLTQKREAEARLLELEREKEKPFARSRDDPDLDSMMKDRLRWGDPMAHLVKNKQSNLALSDLGADEKMKESGFVVPQEIPSHSWRKRGLDYAPNRYGILPGRHWDGVDRSNGYEKQLFKRTNEKRATEREAYLWSVSDM